MFKNKIAISKKFLIAICFISLILFAINSVSAVDLNDTSDGLDIIGNEVNGDINAIDMDKLGNSQKDVLSQSNTVTLNNGKFSDIQNAILNDLNDGDTLVLNGEFTADRNDACILVYKDITFTSTSRATLNAKNLSNIFVVEYTGSGFTFSNLIFKNANSNLGSAIYVFGKDVTIENCLFQNNYANLGGGAIYTAYDTQTNPDYGRNLLIKDCEFKNNRAGIAAGAIGVYGYDSRILNCLFESNSVYNSDGLVTYGGAMQVGKEEFVSNSLIKDCKFVKNKAITVSGTNLSHGGAGCLRDGVVYENCIFEENSADFGGALTSHCSGTIRNCTFKLNTANKYGGAICNNEQENSMNLRIIDCDFTSNSAPLGGAAKLAGYQIAVDDCNFDNNYASIDGGAVFIDTNTLDIVNTNFNYNSAQHNGGAIYVNGKSTNVRESYFRHNAAIANPNVKDDGLGGAIYINGTLDVINNNIFEYNVARNGSAIYYDKSGKNLNVANNVMTKNQAWVYSLPIFANDIYYGETERIGAIIYGGNNIGDYDNLAVSNAIYNAASNRYIKVNGETPVYGATDSGRLYQDSREYNIDVLLTVKHSDGTVVYNKTLKSSYLGEVSDTLSNLKPGTYTVTAKHFEDNYYKTITNQTKFVVKSQIDVAVSKNTDYESYNYNDQVVWTINVVNNGPNDATGVKVNDVLPSGLVYQSSSASVGSYSDGVWTIGSLAKGKSATLKITTLINKTGSIINAANVIANEFDWNTTNNKDSQKIAIPKAADLSVLKQVNVSRPNFGDLVKWTVTVRNNGPDAASGVVVSDVLPSGLVYRSSSASVGSYVDGKWTIGALTKGASASLEIITLVNATGSIVNKATVKGKEYDPNLANNDASKGISVSKSADLSVLKQVNVSRPNFGDLVKWTVTVLNNGPDAASGVVVSDVLPSGLVYRSSSASVGSYVDGKWTIGALAKGASASLEIIALVNATGSIINKASVTGKEYDLNLANNDASKGITVSKSADLSVLKQVNVSRPNFGDLVKWTVTVLNNGPDAASGVFVSDVLPSGLVYRSSSASVGSYVNGKWTIGNLAKGKSVSLDIVCLVNKTGSFKNVVSVTGNEYDVNKTNNKYEASISVAKAADLAVLKQVNVSRPNFGDLVKWTVTVLNNGPDAASGVFVSDVLPSGLVYRSSSASVGSYVDGKWTIGNLAKGRSVSLDIVCLVNKTGSFKNVASVTGNEYDVNKTNNKYGASISVAKAADLEVRKVVNVSNPNYHESVKWTVTVRNNGPDAASGVVVSDVLPEGLVFVSSSGNYSNGKWTIGNLAKGKSVSLDIVCLVNKTGSFKNVVSVTGNEYDVNLLNNNASRGISVAKAADLEVRKVVNNSNPNYHESVKWTVTVRNNGPDAASGVVVSDVLPEGLVFVSSSGNYSNGKWTIGNLAKGKSVSLDIVCLVNKTGSFKNVVSVTGNEYDVNLLNNNASRGISVAKAADLEVRKVVNNSNPNYHESVKWTVTVRNNGPDAASGVVVSDVLPEGLVFVSSSGNYSNGKWTIGNLAKGKSVSLDIVCLVNKTGSFKNVVSVTGNEYDVNLLNNNASRGISVAKAADLEVRKVVNNSNPNYHESVKWTITVKNNGPDAASGVVVSDVLPKGLVFVSSSGNYSNGKWTIGNLAKGKSVSLDIVCLVNKTGSFKNIASVTGNEYDVNLLNNNASRGISVAKAADLEVRKVVNNSNPNYHESVKWTITVKNNGPDAASGVVVSDVLPKGLVFVSSSGNYSNGKWTIGNLAKGKSVSLDIVCLVNKTGSFKNIASVTGNEYDVNLLNNNASRGISVAKAADLEVRKVVNNSNPNYHESVKWTITVKNNGPDAATGVLVEDILPEGLVLINANGNYVDGKWIIGTLSAFSSKTLEIITFVNKTGLIINNAHVHGDEYDYDNSNNNDNSSINVPYSCDLEITKIVDNPTPLYHDNVKWIILVKNNGPDKATDVKVNELLPEAFELVRSTPSKGYYIGCIWSIGDLDVGEKVNLEIITKVIKTGNFTNNVDVRGNEFDYNMSNNKDSKYIKVYPAIDLKITKKVNNTSPNYYDLVKWTIVVGNNGPDNASQIEITDILPKGLEFIDYTSSKGFYTNGIWKFCCLEVGEHQTLEIITRIKDIGEIKNFVSANAKEYDYDTKNNKDESVIDVAPACDLDITKLANQSVINYKELVKWTLIVKNNGPSDATNVLVLDSLPEGLTFISAQGDGDYSTLGTWYVGKIASGQTKELTIITRCDSTGDFNNIAVVRGNEFDYNSTNDQSEKSIIVPPAADLAITKTVSKSQYNVGELISYTIEVVNNGPDSADNINVTEIKDDSLEFKSVFAASGDYDGLNNVWYIKSLASGEKTALYINAISTKEGWINNKVSINSSTFDYNLDNNYAECILDIIKIIIDPNNPFNPGLYSRFKDNGLELGKIAKAGIEMKETGIPIGLLFIVSLFSLAFCGSKISKKR